MRDGSVRTPPAAGRGFREARDASPPPASWVPPSAGHWCRGRSRRSRSSPKPETQRVSGIFGPPSTDISSDPGTLTVIEYRLIDEADGERYFAATGVQNSGVSVQEPNWPTVVCFGVELDDGSGAATCRDLAIFQRQGLELEAPSDDALAPYYRWGPTGGVQLLERGGSAP